MHFDTGFLFARLRSLFEPIIYNGCKELCAAKIEYMQRAWPLLEAFLANNTPYLCGGHLTLGDVACISSVCSVDAIAPIDVAKYPKLLAWIERMHRELPRYEEDCLAGGVALQKYVKSQLN